MLFSRHITNGAFLNANCCQWQPASERRSVTSRYTHASPSFWHNFTLHFHSIALVSCRQFTVFKGAFSSLHFVTSAPPSSPLPFRLQQTSKRRKEKKNRKHKVPKKIFFFSSLPHLKQSCPVVEKEEKDWEREVRNAIAKCYVITSKELPSQPFED